MIFEIPLSPTPQKFSISLGETEYSLTVQWRDPAPGWVLDIASATNEPIVEGIPLVTGVDLLEQYAYLGFAGQLRVQTDGDSDAVPTFGNLGINSHVYFVTRS